MASITQGKLTVLVADDSDDMRSVIAFSLEARGHEVVEAADGKVAQRLLRQRPFDVVISDVLMPEADGFELLAATRALQPKARIVMMSGGGLYSGARENLVIATQLGADAIIRKPFTPAELVKIVESTVSGRAPEPNQ